MFNFYFIIIQVSTLIKQFSFLFHTHIFIPDDYLKITYTLVSGNIKTIINELFYNDFDAVVLLINKLPIIKKDGTMIKRN